ncbi:MAG: right-handed parallel beta-helix repeat-containing protein, partial [Thermoplasmata archaeon]|nr:right-handed parallel beta-helix repeat-containing protein [Thermoplasmata archaeon]
MRRLMSLLLCALLISTAFAFFGPNIVVTDVSAEIVEGEGNCFEITNSTYLNVTLCSSEVVSVTLESIPGVVSFTIENVTSAQSTEIVISGFELDKTYYRHENGYLMESFVADQDGNHSYTQDISEPHHVFIQEEAGTKYIKDDATGGDCTSIGTWDSGSKTCTLTSDVFEMIVIDSDGVTLDGDGHSVTRGVGSYCIYAVYSSEITITNVVVSGFTYGIWLGFSSSITLSGNTVSGNDYSSIYISGSSSITLSGNTVSGNGIGIHLHYSDSSTISGNTVSGNGRWGIYLHSSSSSTISGNTFSGNGDGICLGSSSSITISGNTFSSNSHYGIWLDRSGSITISGNTVSGPGSAGIYLYYSSSNTISGNTVSGNHGGISVGLYSDSNTISGNTVSNNDHGIYLVYSSSNTISGNTVSNNIYRGIYLGYSSSNTISGNTVSGNGIGIYLHYSSSNTIFHNNFIDNTDQLYNYQSTNTWDNGDGEGNYWSDYTGLDDGSGGRVAGDGVGDTDLPHQGVDWYPLMNPWNHDPVDAIEKLKQYIEELDIPHGIKNSLISQLNAAENALSNGQEKAAV